MSEVSRDLKHLILISVHGTDSSRSSQLTFLWFTGNTWLEDGSPLNLNITCQNGSQPFNWCWKIFDYENVSEAIKFNYKPVNYSDHCNFSIKHCFPKNGSYILSIVVENEISLNRKLLAVHNYIRKSSCLTISH